jgi:thiopeptide-type bacteriocin biosynthesis protein
MKNNLTEPQRIFIAGSEWLYYNIYIGPQTSDKFLTFILNPLTNSLIEEGIIDKWFYIRYKDENGLHLRVRFHLCEVNKINEVLFRFHDLVMPFIQKKLIAKVTINSYKRELERYGKDTIVEFETLFFISSKLIISIIELTENNQENRWLYGMKAIDTVLEGWNFNVEQKKQLLENLKIGFGKEFGVDKDIRKQLSKKYRDNKVKIENLFSNTDEELDSLLNDFDDESQKCIGTIIQKVRATSVNESAIINDLLGSYIHMHCNRLFQSKQRKNEWVLYDLLYEYYYSKLARYKNTLKLQLENN